jgi:hypothetical protein
MDNQPDPAPVPEQPAQNRPLQVSPAQAAYFQACQHLTELSMKALQRSGAVAQNAAQFQFLANSNSAHMQREIEMTALVRLLALKGLIQQDEFFTAFVNVSGQVAKQLQEALQAPRILVAEQTPPRNPK